MNYNKLLFYIIITYLIGSFFAIVINNSDLYSQINKPFEIPSIVFPIVWSILYLLMGISAYMISQSDSYNKGNALKIYFIQLIINSLWTLFFFGLTLYLFSFIWILLLILSVIIMIYHFYRIKKLAAYINIPYLLWLMFAAYLNYMIYYLN